MKNLKPYSNESVTESMAFLPKDMRMRAMRVLKELGVKVPTERQVKEMVAKLTEFIKQEKLGVVFEQNTDNTDR